MIPDADIWRAATLMLKRYGENAQSESARRANELAAKAIARRGGLAPDHPCRRATREHNTIRPGALSKFSSKRAIGNLRDRAITCCQTDAKQRRSDISIVGAIIATFCSVLHLKFCYPFRYFKTASTHPEQTFA